LAEGDNDVDQYSILLADDNVLLRSALAKLLPNWGRGRVVGEACNGTEAIERARQLRPDLVLMDIRMPECDGIEATRVIKSEMPETKVIVLTVSEEEDDLFEAIRAGAHGYLLKNMRPDELFGMLDGAVAGEAVVSPEMAKKILNAFVDQVHRTATSSEPDVELTVREREVLELASSGATNKEIAAQLYISVGTVKNHIHRILDKLHLKNRAQMAAYIRMRRVSGWI